jgi:hypothetical protein
MDRIVREAIEVVLHPLNMNKEDGSCLSNYGNILFAP